MVIKQKEEELGKQYRRKQNTNLQTVMLSRRKQRDEVSTQNPTLFEGRKKEVKIEIKK